jgi:arylsulfatase A-like enzyme
MGAIPTQIASTNLVQANRPMGSSPFFGDREFGGRNCRDQAAELKRVLARQMEIYAGFLEFTDYHTGRLIDALDQLQVLENTVIYYIIGDNGASAEGTLQGTFNEMIPGNGLNALETADFLAARIDNLGSPESYNHYAVGWAHAMDTPYQWTKQVASHWGGTRNGTIVHWPKGIRAKAEIRHQFHHVIDLAPTILEAAQLPQPHMVNGVAQVPMQGVSMLYSFDDAKAAERRETQYFEMFGNRGIYHKGWTAVTRHRTPWIVTGKAPPFDDDVWELYDTNKDWSQAHDLSKEMPEKLHELQRLWIIEATRNNVLPMDDRGAERFNPDLAGRPVLVRGQSQILAKGMGGLNENALVNTKNKSHWRSCTGSTSDSIFLSQRPQRSVCGASPPLVRDTRSLLKVLHWQLLDWILRPRESDCGAIVQDSEFLVKTPSL